MATFRTSQPGSAADASVPHLILVGLPGAGKSTVGSALARELDRSFLDFDVLGKRMMAEFRGADRLVLAEADRFAAMENYLQQTVLTGDRDLFVNGVRDLYDVLQ